MGCLRQAGTSVRARDSAMSPKNCNFEAGCRRILRRVFPAKVIAACRRVWSGLRRRLYSPRRYWTARGKGYAREFPPCGARNEELIVRVLSGLGASSVLDVGCGYGRYLKVLRAQLRLERLCGVDISPSQIAHAREYLKDFPDVQLLIAPATKLPFPEASFDAIFTYGLMIHLPMRQAEAFLDEAGRVGKRWGVFLETNANLNAPHLNPYYFFAHDYDKLFAKHGLRVIQRHVISERLSEYLFVVDLAFPRAAN